MQIRKPIIMGNWKMNGSTAMLWQLAGGIAERMGENTALDVVIFPPAVYLAQACQVVGESLVAVGAQDASQHQQGAYTGEISVEMLADIGCEYVLIGHSERRQYHGENNALCRAKFVATLNTGLTPVLCVGETLTQRQADEAFAVIEAQLKTVFDGLDPADASQAIVAYEPVWAIGTGLSATPEQAQAVHAFIRKTLGRLSEKLAKQVRIVYGGSLKPSSAPALLSMPDIDGGLIGGASLVLDDFVKICEYAVKG